MEIFQVMFCRIQSHMTSHVMISWFHKVSECLAIKLISHKEFCLKKHCQKAMETLLIFL